MASLELKESSYEVTGRIMLVEYDTDVWLTKVQLGKDGDFIDALAFSQSTAMFNLTEWDNGDYKSCILRGYYDDETVFVDSDKFSITVNKNITSPELGRDGRVQSIITVYKGDEQLIPTEEIPSNGQFRVAISSTENCSASIKDLNTIYVNYIASNADEGVITLDINVEGKTNFVKRIKLVKSVTRETVSEIEKKVSIAEQRITDDAITNMVKKDFYTKDETNTKMSLVEQTVDNWGVRIVENERTLTELRLTDEEFEVSIGKKADETNIISTINASSEGIKIQGSKVNITGYVTFSDLSSAGQTTINGSNITTGTLSGNRISGGTIVGTLFKTHTRTSQGGVEILEDVLNIGYTTFHYADNRFKIEAESNVSISSENGIHIMAGINQDGTTSGTGEVFVYDILRVSKKLFVNGTEITGKPVAVFG